MPNGEVTTNEIMEFLHEHMVTKEDAKQFLTKEDAKQFLTKEDAKQFVTKEHFERGLTGLKIELLDALDDKLANLKGDLTVLMRKEDRKLVGLIALLRNKKLLTEEEAKALMAMEPFPQLAA